MVHPIEPGEIYATCRGGATSHYPASVVVVSVEVIGSTRRIVHVHEEHRPQYTYAIPGAYFHATRQTKQGSRRITGYYRTGKQEVF